MKKFCIITLITRAHSWLLRRCAVKFPWKRGGAGGDWEGRSTPSIPSWGVGLCRCMEKASKGSGPQLHPALCSPTGAKRSVPLELSVSGVPSSVTATTEVNVHRPQGPVNVNPATRALAAKSGCAPRAGMAQAAPCPVPVIPKTLSGMSCG